MNNLFMSIDTVINALRDYKSYKHETEGKYREKEFDFVDLIESINFVSNTFFKYNEEHAENGFTDLRKITESICVIGSSILQKVYNSINIPDVKEQTSILSLIRKQYNENLHSDFIAALLDPVIMGEFANKFFIRLVVCQHNLKNNEIKTNFQKPHREIRLDSISPEIKDPNIGAKRIDILVEAQNHVLLIENKVFTFESENQTKDYYRWAKSGYAPKEIVPFFLSPSGMPSSSSKFIAINYFDLYEFIIELENTILLSQINAIQYSSKYLKEKGYDT